MGDLGKKQLQPESHSHSLAGRFYPTLSKPQAMYLATDERPVIGKKKSVCSKHSLAAAASKWGWVGVQTVWRISPFGCRNG